MNGKKIGFAQFSDSRGRRSGRAFAALARTLALLLALVLVLGSPVEARAAGWFSWWPKKKAPEKPAVAAGDLLKIGRFEQDGNAANGAEPIEWRVLEVQDGHALVISEVALECIPFDERNNSCSWFDSTLRSWLNGDFYETALMDGEDLGGVEIVTRYLATQTSLYGSRLTTHEATERIFLLSTEEVEDYFDPDDRVCIASAYAQKRGAYVNQETGGSWWWLRTPGDRRDKVASVNSDGAMDYDGGSVTSDKGVVRPAMWVYLGAETK